MGCENKIRKAITSTCETQTIGGIEQVVYVMNRLDLSNVTYDPTDPSLITTFTLIPGTTSYKLTGIKKSLNCGFERVVVEDMGDRFKHKFNFKGFQFDSASVENIDQMADLVAIVERKGRFNVNGIFVAYGIQNGLYISTDSNMTNDANGTRNIEMTSLDGSDEKYSQNNVLINGTYADTKSFLESTTESESLLITNDDDTIVTDDNDTVVSAG